MFTPFITHYDDVDSMGKFPSFPDAAIIITYIIIQVVNFVTDDIDVRTVREYFQTFAPIYNNKFIKYVIKYLSYCKNASIVHYLHDLQFKREPALHAVPVVLQDGKTARQVLDVARMFVQAQDAVEHCRFCGCVKYE